MTFALKDTRHGGLNGWIEAGLFVLAISTLTVVYAIAQQAGAHIVVFILYAMGFAAAGMLAASGIGERPLDIALARQSMVFGASTVLLEAFYFALLGILTPAETSLSLRLSVPISLLVGWLLYHRTMDWRLWLGSAIIVAAVVPVLAGAPPEGLFAASLLVFACAIAVTVKTFASEFHPANRAARNVIDKLRVTGLVVLSTTLLGAAFVVPLVALAELGVIQAADAIPRPADFAHIPTLITAIVLGAPVFVAMTYLTFSSVVKIGTESFLATSAITPFAVLMIESVAVALGLLSEAVFDWTLMPMILIGVVGVLIVVYARHHR